MLPNPLNCSHSYVLAHSASIHGAHAVQLLFAFSSILVISIGCCRLEQPRNRASCFRIHSGLRIIFGAGLGFGLLLCVSGVVLRSHDFINALRNRPLCAYIWPSIHCLAARLPISTGVLGLNLIVVSLLVERWTATFCNSFYARHNRLLGIGLVAFVMTTTIFLLYYIYHNEDLNQTRAYCMATSMTSNPKMIRVMIVFVFLNLSTASGGIYLFSVSKDRMKCRNIDYTLEKSLELNENYLTLQLVAPLAVVHFLIFLLYAVAFLSVRIITQKMDVIQTVSLIQWAYVINFVHPTIVAAFGFRLRSQLLSRRAEWLVNTNDQTEIYFAMFDALIDSNPRNY
ncbi:hypothetical protein M3Y95_00658500 [Aphelenchoides besseyi]|nr:hypothetical protein M3Y95_00658500 [Aphelenchoides besseyi]